MDKRLLETLGLCRRAGILSYGHDAVFLNIIQDKAKLVIFADDFSEKTRQKITKTAEENKIETILTQFKMEEFSKILKKPAGILSVNDGAFAKKIKEQLI